MANIVKIKRSGTANSIPSANALEYGELAINYADGLIFYKNASNTVVTFDVSGYFNIQQINDNVSALQVEMAMQVF